MGASAGRAASLSVAVETYPIAGRFVIARGARTEATVVVVTLRDGAAVGRGECVPYPRYGESVGGVVAAIAGVRDRIEADADRAALGGLLPAGAARNALDCALWDLEAKRTGVPAWRRAGVGAPAPVTTAYTLSVDAPAAMGAAARRARHRPLLKVKLAGAGDAERIAAVRAGAPDSTLIVDANEAWAEADLAPMIAACARAGVALIEQPLPAGADGALARVAHRVPICADESIHDLGGAGHDGVGHDGVGHDGLAALRGRYDAVNVKLDKTGGLTEALAVVAAAETLGFATMVGCMVGTSLAMAPATLLAGRARFVDLDGPLLLAADRPDGLRYEGSTLHPPAPALWG